jgi:phage virion morphogenesis protein
MADGVNIKVNDTEFRAKLNTFGQKISTPPLLKIAGAVMLGSIDRTFREQGSPAGSWKPLKAWTRQGALSRIQAGRGKRAGSLVAASSKKNSALAPGRLILILSGRLKNSVTTQVSGNSVFIGTNLIYARIQQQGGATGRKHAAIIPARPYVVFRPEDPQRIQEALQNFIDQQAQQAGLK